MLALEVKNISIHIVASPSNHGILPSVGKFNLHKRLLQGINVTKSYKFQNSRFFNAIKNHNCHLIVHMFFLNSKGTSMTMVYGFCDVRKDGCINYNKTRFSKLSCQLEWPFFSSILVICEYLIFR